MYLHFECQCLSTNSWAYFCYEAVIASALPHYLYNDLLCNVVPHDLKLANVTPLFKNDPRNKTSSYRPASLASQICKIIKSILEDNIINHLCQNCLNNNNGYFYVLLLQRAHSHFI